MTVAVNIPQSLADRRSNQNVNFLDKLNVCAPQLVEIIVLAQSHKQKQWIVYSGGGG